MRHPDRTAVIDPEGRNAHLRPRTALHVLIVHAVVVLVPLAVPATIAVALWPAARRRFGWAAVVLTAAATICIPIATNSGEDLRDRLAPTDLIRAHARLGDELLVFVAVLLVVSTALVWLDRRVHREQSGTTPLTGKPVIVALAALTIVAAVVSAVQVVRIGDSGARAAWAGTNYVTPQADNHG